MSELTDNHSYLQPQIRVLHVEDNRTDAVFIQSLLKKIPTHEFVTATVASLGEAFLELKQFHPDVILLDLTVEDSTGISTVERMRDAAPQSPIVITSGNDSQLIAQTAIRKGAQDYLFKNQINRDVLNRAICNAIDRKLIANKNDEKHRILEAVMGSNVINYWDWDIKGDIQYISPGLKKMLGYGEGDAEEKTAQSYKLVYPDDEKRVLNAFRDHVDSNGNVPYEYIARYLHKDGSVHWVACSGKVIEWDKGGQPVRMVGWHVDVSAFDQYRQTLLLSDEAVTS